MSTSWMLAAPVAMAHLVRRCFGCHHPNPHYLRTLPATETRARIDEPHYMCYECGRIWPIVQRDPAWRPTAVVQRFSGYDGLKASQAATRAAIEAEQRRFLAVRRAIPVPPVSLEPLVDVAPEPPTSNVIEFSRRHA